MLICDISNASVFLTNISYISHDKKYYSKLWRNEDHPRISNCFNKNDHEYAPLVENTSRSFPHSGLITGIVTSVTRRVTVVKQELLTIPELCGVHVSRSLVLCVMFCISLYVLLPFFFWSWWCLSFFDLRILITPLVSSNSS